jgi:hypothetical protein
LRNIGTIAQNHLKYFLLGGEQKEIWTFLILFFQYAFENSTFGQNTRPEIWLQVLYCCHLLGKFE